ncbi:NIPSNAP family protein [Streptomyces enissocaesilis]
MTALGQFRALDDPDRFVWLRGFDGMPSRAEALESFYGGPVWQAHRDKANATMTDSDDVLLLWPASVRGGFPVPAGARQAAGEPAASSTPLGLATVRYGHGPFDTAFVEFFEQRVRPVPAGAGGEPPAYLRSEDAPNTFPALPVRANEEVFVWFARFTGEDHLDDRLNRLQHSEHWREEVLPPLSKRWARPPRQRLRPTPTERSVLR